MLSVAMLSKWHVHAKDYAQEASEHPHIRIALVWDEDQERGVQWANELGVPFEADLNKVLTNETIDAVIVNAPTNQHKDIIMQAARHGKHIFSEKILAFTTEECDEIFAVIDEHEVHLMLGLKRLAEPYFLYAQQVLDEGLLGKLNIVRCRLAHNGGLPRDGNPFGALPSYFYDPEQTGGGAMIDLGAHPIYIVNRLAGPGQGLYARLSQSVRNDVDDNSVIMIDYDSGALGIIEAGFVSNGSFQLELHGTEGILMMEKGSIRFKSIHINGNEWTTPQQLPASLPTPLSQWVEQIRSGVTPAITRDDIWRLTQINEAALLSHREQRRVKL